MQTRRAKKRREAKKIADIMKLEDRQVKFAKALHADINDCDGTRSHTYHYVVLVTLLWPQFCEVCKFHVNYGAQFPTPCRCQFREIHGSTRKFEPLRGLNCSLCRSPRLEKGQLKVCECSHFKDLDKLAAEWCRQNHPGSP